MIEYRTLGESDLARLGKWRGLGEYMADYYGVGVQEFTPIAMHEVFVMWLNDCRPKVEPVDFAYAFGTLLGDFLRAKLVFEWFMLNDGQEDFCLKGGGWETYPIQYVWKRVAPQTRRNDEGDFFTGAWEMFFERVPARGS